MKKASEQMFRDGGGSIGAEELGQVTVVFLFLFSGCICGNIHKFQSKIFWCWGWNDANILTHMNIYIWLTQVMTSFGWSPSEEELKDMVNVIDQVLNLSLIRLSLESLDSLEKKLKLQYLSCHNYKKVCVCAKFR